MKKKRTASSEAGFRQTPRNPRVRRDDIDIFRTIYWFETLRERTGLVTAYALERQFEPEAFGESSEEVRYHRNKWPPYRDGKRTPRAALIGKAEVQVPGSAQSINHVFWQVLRIRFPVQKHVDQWIKALEPGIQNFLFESSRRAPKRGLAVGRTRRPVDRRLLETLGRHASLDALAALTILLREAAALGRPDIAFMVARPAIHLLVAHCSTRPMQRFASRLFDLYRKDILPLGVEKGMTYTLDEYPFETIVAGLNRFVARSQEKENKQFGWDEALQIKLNALIGKYSLEARIAFMPRPVAVGN